MGKVQYGIQTAEEKSILYKRSIYVAKDIKTGEIFTEDNLKIIRPALGLAPKYWEEVLGKTAKIDLKKGTPLSLDFI